MIMASQRKALSALLIAVVAVTVAAIVGLFWSELSASTTQFTELLHTGGGNADGRTPIADFEELSNSSRRRPGTVDLRGAPQHREALEAERWLNDNLLSEVAALRSDLAAKSAIAEKAIAEANHLRQLMETGSSVSQEPLHQETEIAEAAPSDIETQIALSQAALDAALTQVQEAESVSAEQRPPIEQHEPKDQHQEKTKEQTKTATTEPAADTKTLLLWQDQIARAPSAPSSPEVARLIARATTLLGQGNIGAARAVLERAVESGDAQAHFMLAETYDPAALARWGTQGTRGEVEKARVHYARAYAGNIQEAKDRLNALW
jgi:hypothetical protein